ncbi:MAG: restriction endonuclease subunit S [Patescibacteria group bacterium]
MLDKADAVRRKRLESLDVLDGFLGSVFLETFGDPVRNEKAWVRSEGASAIRSIEAGTSMGGEAQAPGSEDWAVLKISAVTSGWYLPTERKTVSALPDRPIFPKRGDLLFSRANTRDLVAATCLVDRDEDRTFLPDKLWKVSPNSEVATAEYLRFLFTNSGFRRMLTQQATGSSGSMLNVSQDKVLRARFPLPPLHLQRQFADLVWTTYGLRDSMLGASSQANRLLETAAWQAFRAKLEAD